MERDPGTHHGTGSSVGNIAVRVQVSHAVAGASPLIFNNNDWDQKKRKAWDNTIYVVDATKRKCPNRLRARQTPRKGVMEGRGGYGLMRC